MSQEDVESGIQGDPGVQNDDAAPGDDQVAGGGDELEELRVKLAQAEEKAERYRRNAQSSDDKFRSLERRVDDLRNAAAAQTREPSVLETAKQNWSNDPAVLWLAQNQQATATEIDGLRQTLERSAVTTLREKLFSFIQSHDEVNAEKNPTQAAEFVDDLDDRLPDGAKYSDMMAVVNGMARPSPAILSVIGSLDTKLNKAHKAAFSSKDKKADKRADSDGRVDRRAETLDGKNDTPPPKAGGKAGDNKKSYKDAFKQATGRR